MFFTVETGFVFTLILCACVFEINGNKCDQLIAKALDEYYQDKAAADSSNDKESLAHGNPNGRLCRYLKTKLDDKCLKQSKHCQGKGTGAGEQSSVIQENSNRKDSTGGRKTKPGRDKRETKRANRQKRSLEYECNQPPVDCSKKYNNKYRSFDGTCNNLYEWEWGMADRIQTGFSWADYDDGYNTPKTAASGSGTLPNPRQISNIIHEAATSQDDDPSRSLFIMQMGQFLAHDMILTHLMTKPDGSPLDCCNADNGHAECFEIYAPTGDPHFTPGECLNFARSEARLSCYTNVREQVNAQTSYLDHSQVYGVTKTESNSLRTMSGGLLKTVLDKLPKDENDQLCDLSTPSDPVNYYCPIAGDVRVMEQPGLASMHTLWVREHNRLANALSAIHPSWSDQKIFQQARKINIAEWQHIIYNEFLPEVIGQAAVNSNNLNVAPSRYKDTYSTYVDATIANSFGAAIFRFGHSLVRDRIALAQVDDEVIITEEDLKDNFFKPFLYHTNSHKGIDNILKWETDVPCHVSDRKMQPAVQTFLFNDALNKSLDLAALNINRGRDHGLPSYNNFRSLCGLPPANNFGVGNGGLVDHELSVANLLAQAYNNPNDIDLFTGHMSEKRLPDSMLGPTGQCLLITQFKRLRDGDRFFFERQTSSPSITFTLNQLNAIKQVKMSTLFCLNTAPKAGKRVQENIFRLQGTGNDYVDCSTVNGVDMSYW